MLSYIFPQGVFLVERDQAEAVGEIGTRHQRASSASIRPRYGSVSAGVIASLTGKPLSAMGRSISAPIRIYVFSSTSYNYPLWPLPN